MYQKLKLVDTTVIEKIELYLQLVCVKTQVNQSVGTYTDLLLRGNINVKELDYGCGPSSVPMNVEVDRCEVNKYGQDCEDDGGDEVVTMKVMEM